MRNRAVWPLGILLIFLFTFVTPPTNLSAAPADAAQDIRQALQKASKGAFNCTAVRKEIRRLRPRYPDFHFSFAGRRALTITGILGCGYAWSDISQVDANTRAMQNCRKSEQELGTANGSKVCRLRN